MIIKRIPNGKWKQNCYIVTNDFGETVIIDPGSEDHIIYDYCETKKQKILAILNTHGHYDHVGGIKLLKDKYQYLFPSFELSKSFNNNLNLESNGYYKNYDTNVFEKVLINDLRYSPIPIINTNGSHKCGKLRMYDSSRQFIGLGEITKDGRVSPKRLINIT